MGGVEFGDDFGIFRIAAQIGKIESLWFFELQFRDEIKDFLTRFEYWRMTLGLLIIGVVILAPDGIVGSLRKASERLGITKRPEGEV